MKGLIAIASSLAVTLIPAVAALSVATINSSDLAQEMDVATNAEHSR